jgi:hypothetical protein
MSGLELKHLQDTLILFAGVYCLITALEIAADRARVRYPPDTLKMVGNILVGLFLVMFYLTVARKNANNSFFPTNNFLD